MIRPRVDKRGPSLSKYTGNLQTNVEQTINASMFSQCFLQKDLHWDTSDDGEAWNFHSNMARLQLLSRMNVLFRAVVHCYSFIFSMRDCIMRFPNLDPGLSGKLKLESIER